MKQTSRKPDNSDVNPRNRNAAYPNAIAMSDCTQNALLTLHVSISFNVLAIDVPAALADNSRYANTCTTTTTTHYHSPSLTHRVNREKQNSCGLWPGHVQNQTKLATLRGTVFRLLKFPIRKQSFRTKNIPPQSHSQPKRIWTIFSQFQFKLIGNSIMLCVEIEIEI